MTRIYLIRHAEAEGNIYRIAHGQYNSALTDKGWLQVRALQKRFEDKNIDAVYSSDLYRAMATSTAIYKPKGLQLRLMEDLREIDMGRWECVPWAQLSKDHPEQLYHFNKAPDRYQPDGGEDYTQVRERMLRAIEIIAAENPGKAVAVFSHGAAIRTLLAAAEGKSLEEMGQTPYGENTAVSLLEVDGEKIHVVFRDSDNHLVADHLQTLAGQRWSKQQKNQREQGLCFEAMDPQEDGERYLFCRAEYLKSVYGHLNGFDGVKLLQEAGKLPVRYPAALMKATFEGEMAGMFQLFPDYGVEDHVGYIDFYYLLPPYRGQGLGIQLLGQIIMFYRQLGKDKLRLFCEASNTRAQTFFKRCGFGDAGSLPDGRVILQKFIGFQPL